MPFVRNRPRGCDMSNRQKSRRRRAARLIPVALVVAITASLALPSLASAGGLSSLLDFGAELLDGVGTKVPDSLIAPAQASEAFVGDPAVEDVLNGDSTLSDTATTVNENVGSTADQFGTNVDTATQQDEKAIAAEVVRDCVKDALTDAAWDVWWGYYHREKVDVSQVLVNAAAGCLHTYTQAAWPESKGLARALTYSIDLSVGAVIRYHNDAATVSNWLQATSDSIPS
ncbi:MAG: hypothetical protein ACTHMY_20340 [Solirubrobacteraceae bacterium]